MLREFGINFRNLIKNISPEEDPVAQYNRRERLNQELVAQYMRGEIDFPQFQSKFSKSPKIDLMKMANGPHQK